MQSRDNPWVTITGDGHTETEHPSRVASARWTPGAEVRVTQGLPVVDAPLTPDLWVVGAHGGAGATTWAHLLGAGDAGCAWPRPPRAVQVLVVARANRTGLRAAQAAAIQWASGALEAVDLVGLLLVADAPGRMPKGLRDYARLVRGAFPQVIEMGWVESWRVQEAWKEPTPREAQRVLARVQELRKEH